MDRQKLLAVIAAVALVVIASIAYYQYRKSQAPEKAAPPAAPQQAAEPAIRNPVPEVPAETPLPAINESDGPFRDSLSGVLGRDAVGQFLAPNDVIRRIVVTVDNLPRKKVAVERRPILPTGGTFATSGSDESLTLNPNNYSRYAPLVRLVEAADANQLAALYFRYYPLFQRAYEDLGYPNAYFNDRLVEVIDNMLATPQVNGPIKLVQPRVFYEFADPALESRSSGQKLLIRMGNENAAAIKAKLTEVRNIIVSKKPAPGT
jgi:Protein of unknown function (DUF3014)